MNHTEQPTQHVRRNVETLMRNGYSFEQALDEAFADCRRISNPNELLSRDQIESEYKIGRRFLEQAAIKGNGPLMIKLSHRQVRYRRADIENWLAEREATSTADKVRGQ